MLQKVQNNEHCSESSSSRDSQLTRSLTAEDFEVILRKNKKHQNYQNKQRGRVVSCPDESYLRQISSELDFQMIDLRKTGEERDNQREVTIKEVDEDDVFNLEVKNNVNFDTPLEGQRCIKMKFCAICVNWEIFSVKLIQEQ